MNNNQQLLSEYDANHDMYQSFIKKIETLIVELLSHNGVNAHKIESRVKTRDSFQKKTSRPEKAYSTISDIKDVCGMRIITLLEDQANVVAQMIEQNFVVDLEHSVDKRKLLAPASFGYLSLHYVCCLSDERTKLAEYSAFKNIPLEIQIRSVLQHAWAEIEHDLGYKSSIAIPRELRRKFSRIAGLLEIADEEFVEIQQKLDGYRNDIAANIATGSSSVTVDNTSMQIFIENSVLVKDVDEKIAEKFGIGVKPVADNNHRYSYYNHLTKLLDAVKIFTIGDLESKLSHWKEEVVDFATVYDTYTSSTFGVTLSDQKHLPMGRTVFLLPHLIILKDSVPDVVRLQNLKDFFRQIEGNMFAHGLDPEKNADKRATSLSRNLFDQYQKADEVKAL